MSVICVQKATPALHTDAVKSRQRTDTENIHLQQVPTAPCSVMIQCYFADTPNAQLLVRTKLLMFSKASTSNFQLLSLLSLFPG